jgi:ribosomal protein S27E
MDQKAIEDAARAAAAAGFHVGHVFVRHDGDHMHIKCTSCGAEEIVKDYSNGKHPQKFVYQPTRMDGREYVKCESCRRVHDRVVPFAR